TPLGRRVGLVADEAWSRLQRKEAVIAELTQHLQGRRQGQDTLEKQLRRPDISWDDLCRLEPSLCEWDGHAAAVEQVVLETKYAGYIERQAAQVERFRRLESKPIPTHFDFAAVPQLRTEAKEKLQHIRPLNLGQAGRISGISPADLAVLLLYLGTPAPAAAPAADDGP